MKKIRNLVILFYFLAFTINSSAFADRLKDLTSIAGIRSNQLIGYGLVVGLAGTVSYTHLTLPTSDLV